MERERAAVTCDGRLFHRRAAATGNALSPSLSCLLSVCPPVCALWLSGVVYRTKSCTSVFLAGNFLFVLSDTFTVACRNGFDSLPVYRTSYAVRSAITATADLLVFSPSVLEAAEAGLEKQVWGESF